MVNQVDPRWNPALSRSGTDTATYDAGLRSYMLSVYNYMLSGVLLTGMVALGMAYTGAVNALFNPEGGASLLGWVAMLSPLAFVFLFSFKIQSMGTSTAKGMFYIFAVLMGVSLSTIFLRYTGTSIATTFFATAASFAGLSLYGYTTKRDLSGMGTFLIMGVVGLLVAMLLNIFIQSSALAMVISFVGVLIFAGLTAYDTQKIKNMYDYVAGTDMMGKTAIMGALTLYLDFINMFTFLLSILGNRE
ncbi:Bax inhibitor-1/YccA family protein [Sandaracinobacteroides saxicola]|uniref:Bax inhibitor-1/YccA family protein n=1 Tax=Sandaracinobacteroides saxicola TaxID=2759707 RepID=A0A7G5IET4_9SPHN|nr:Bax inhibitor-1/YccA family protein [Sandaracinobacteroides saxicola]QMW21876.1 Bax inhibitor-1/YccA family protein [Sandaracinobacteroides saxicola]